VGATNALQRYLPALSASTAQTAVAVGSLGAMAVAVAALAVVTKIAKDIIDDSQKATQEFIDVNQRYAELWLRARPKRLKRRFQQNEDRNRAL